MRRRARTRLAPTPADYFAQGGQDRVPPGFEWRGLHDLLSEDGRLIREEHDRLVARGEPPKAAAKYLVGWFGGGVAAELGRMHAMTGATFHADDRVRWLVHPGGWPEQVDVSRCVVAAPKGHPWARLADVQVAGDARALRQKAVDALTGTLAPYVEVAHSLAKVGRRALWVEIADGIGLALASRAAGTDGADRVAALDSLTRVDGVPWRSRPRAWVAGDGARALVVGQKGGCCLAFTGDQVAGQEPPLDADERLYRDRFPPDPHAVDYCLTCCLRDAADAEARQVFWAQRRAAAADRWQGP